MRISISNIAWPVEADARVAATLAAQNIDAVDIAPGKYFPDPALATDADIRAVRAWWEDRGLQITGMQALLFGTVGLNIFGSEDVQRKALDRLGYIARLGGLLGARHLVFGSPRNRDRSGLTDQQTQAQAVAFFGRLGDIAVGAGVMFCLEPNPASYGANFMMTSGETADMVLAVDHPGIRMQLDTGAITINGEDPQETLARYGPLVAHIHASEPDLLPLGRGGTDHMAAAQAINTYAADRTVAIEMLATAEDPVASVRRAVELARNIYGDGACSAR